MARIFRKPDRLPNQRYLLLIGAPRSGTTLLATMIGRHAEVGMVNEDVSGKALVKVLGKPVTGNKLCVPNQIQLGRRGGRFPTLLRKLGVIAESPRSRYCILDYLELSNLKLVAILRNGNDAVSSMMGRGKCRFKKAARRWAEAVETIFDLQDRYGERMLIVSFEELLLDPENTMKKVCSFLCLPYQEQMLDGYRYNRYYPQALLDKEKAYRSRKEQIDFGLERRVPAAWKKYQRLLLDIPEATACLRDFCSK